MGPPQEASRLPPSVRVAPARVRPGRATLLYIDFTLYKSLNGFTYHHDGFEDALRFFALYAQWAFLMVLAVLFFVRGQSRSVNGRHGVVAAGFSALLALGVAQLLADWVSRPRPYVAHAADAHLFIARSADPSFPSDHATAAFAIAVALLLRHRKAGMLALGLAMLVSLGVWPWAPITRPMCWPARRSAPPLRW